MPAKTPTPPSSQVSPLQPKVAEKPRCPNCDAEEFGQSKDGGWGEFFECQRCQFSVHAASLDSPTFLERVVAQHRAAASGSSRPQAPRDDESRWLSGS